jgi:hypothetical protein
MGRWRVLLSIILFAAGFGYLLFASFWATAKLPTSELGAENLWYHNCLRFYEKSATHILETATKTGKSTVCLLPETNTSGYMCSSPCNEGLAIELNRQAHASGRTVEIIWWDGYMFPSIPWSRASFSGHWWSGLDKRSIIADAQVSHTENQAVTVETVISNLTIDEKSGTFQTAFDLKIDGVSTITAGDTTMYTGSIKQLRWFVKKNMSVWVIIPIVLILVVLSGIWMVISRFRLFPFHYFYKPIPPPEDFVGPICIITGALFFFAIAYCIRFDRREAFYYKPNNLFFLVDRNSELISPSAVGARSQTKPGPQFVIQNTCLAVLEKLSERGYLRNYNSFWEWAIKIKEVLQCLYESPKYELNQRWNPFLYFCSGREEGPTTLVGVSTPQHFAEAFGEETVSKRFYRESRLILPSAEVQEIASKHEIPEDQPRIAFLFTSACAPYQQEALAYLRQLSNLSSDKQIRNLKATFTVLLPTLPCTGSSEMYNFEEGKLLFARLGSDMVVQTNAAKYNLDTVWAQTAKQLQIPTDRITTSNISANRNDAHFDNITQVPIYQLEELDWNHRARWDNPTDLEPLRTNLLSINDPQKVRGQCTEIATLFTKFAEGRISKEQEPEYTIHILEAKKLDMSILVSAAVILCLFIFYSQYNMVFLDYYLRQKSVRILDWFWIIASFVLLLWYFLIQLWKAHEPMAYAFRGWADVSFIGMILLWLTLFAAPFLTFRLYCWSHSPLWFARIVTGFVAVMLAAVVFCSGLFINSYLIRFGIAIAVWPIILLLSFLLGSRPCCKDPQHGLLDIWRDPVVSCIGKCLLIVLFVHLAYGVTATNSAALELQPFTILFVWCTIGVLIIVSKKLTFWQEQGR